MTSINDKTPRHGQVSGVSNSFNTTQQDKHYEKLYE